MTEISTLFFDLGNVITKPQDAEYAERMRWLIGDKLAMSDFTEAYFACRPDYDRGVLDHRQYWRQVADRLGVQIPEGAFEKLLEADLKSWFNINEDMVDYIRELRGRVRHLVLVSNIHWDGVDYLERQFAWKDLFESRVYSCEHKVNKPQAEIFRIALSKVGEGPESCLFIDDLAENVEGARSVGLHAIQYADLAQLKREIGKQYLLRT